jgi:hypothetical protein
MWTPLSAGLVKSEKGSILDGCKSVRAYFARFDLIHITPDPGLTGLDRANQRMFGMMKVFCGVFVFGRIAASNVSALET